MKKFINKTTGAEMQVADNRAKEYEAAGHTLVASAPKKPAESKKRKGK